MNEQGKMPRMWNPKHGQPASIHDFFKKNPQAVADAVKKTLEQAANETAHRVQAERFIPRFPKQGTPRNPV